MGSDSSRLADDPQAPTATSPGAGIFGQALFAQSPLSTVVYDPAGRITAANAAFERLFELRVADIQASYSILEDAQLAELGLAPSIRRAFEGEPVVLPPLRYDARRVAGAGSTTWTQGYFYPVRDAAGTVAAVVLVHVDLTERRRAEDAARLLAEAGAALAGSLDQQVTLATVARLAVPAVGDFCA
ncbi:MAG TPA: PAS domain-containing protein, partial [Gemmatimonadaceae bacterium]|nr:PAS domain-containing protein [Gemmatimonadaceae bacterium]